MHQDPSHPVSNLGHPSAYVVPFFTPFFNCSQAMVKVLIVDDHAIVRQGYARLIAADPLLSVCGEAGSAEEGYSAYQQLTPDVVITDLSMKGLSGMTLLQKIMARDKHAGVIVCSMYDEASLVASALNNGAKGFVSKSSDPANIVSAIHAVHQGKTYLSEDLQPRQWDSANSKEAQAIKELTAREFEILKMLAEGKSVAECAKYLHLSEKTVHNYQTTIRTKLKVETPAALVHLAHRHGIIKTLG
jgi:DNA-binding NarL/FixJ family response regulator